MQRVHVSHYTCGKPNRQRTNPLLLHLIIAKAKRTILTISGSTTRSLAGCCTAACLLKTPRLPSAPYRSRSRAFLAFATSCNQNA